MWHYKVNTESHYKKSTRLIPALQTSFKFCWWFITVGNKDLTLIVPIVQFM